jgi:hypothetical protein
MTENEKEYYDAGEAVIYLAKKWGMKSYSVDAFKMLRHRRGIKPDIEAKTASLWKKSTLDTIEKPDRGGQRSYAPRPNRRKKSQQAGGEDSGSSSSV